MTTPGNSIFRNGVAVSTDCARTNLLDNVMDVTNALAFLERHQPLPPDDQLSADLIREYDEVRKFFIEHPDPRCIPLFLNSFGDESCFGVYQLVEGRLSPVSAGRDCVSS